MNQIPQIRQELVAVYGELVSSKTALYKDHSLVSSKTVTKHIGALNGATSRLLKLIETLEAT